MTDSQALEPEALREAATLLDEEFGLGVTDAHEVLRRQAATKRIYDCALRVIGKLLAQRPQPSGDEVERAFLAVMNANDRELALPSSAWAERNLLKRRIAVALAAMDREPIAVGETGDMVAIPRQSLIDLGRGAGAFLADTVSNDFLELVPAEAISRLESAADRVKALEEEGYHGLDTPERVCFYEQDFYVLSNFSAFSIIWKGHRFDTSEAVYHWEKFNNPDPTPYEIYVLDSIREAPSAHVAFKIGQSEKRLRRKDWDDVKVDVMRDILRAKVEQHEYVRRKLLATGERELVENSWRDDYWGWGPNRDGQNMLGKLWMEVRAELRQALGGQ